MILLREHELSALFRIGTGFLPWGYALMGSVFAGKGDTEMASGLLSGRVATRSRIRVDLVGGTDGRAWPRNFRAALHPDASVVWKYVRKTVVSAGVGKSRLFGQGDRGQLPF